MRGMTVSWLSRRALFSATACAAFAVALGSIPSKAQEQDVRQAEWPQSYETSPKMAIQREATPILSSATVDATQAAIERYQDLVAKGGWGTVPAGPELRVGSKGGAVEALRQRLVASGDLDPVAGSGPVYDLFVEAGVKRFQARNGLNRSGVVDKDTLASLNVSAAARLQQLGTNLVRLRSYSGDLGERFVVVNLPGASVETVEIDGVVFAPPGRRRPDRPSVADHADQGDGDQFQPVLARAAFADQEGSDPEDEGRCGNSCREKIHILDKVGTSFAVHDQLELRRGDALQLSPGAWQRT